MILYDFFVKIPLKCLYFKKKHWRYEFYLKCALNVQNVLCLHLGSFEFCTVLEPFCCF